MASFNDERYDAEVLLRRRCGHLKDWYTATEFGRALGAGTDRQCQNKVTWLRRSGYIGQGQRECPRGGSQKVTLWSRDYVMATLIRIARDKRRKQARLSQKPNAVYMRKYRARKRAEAA